MLCLLKRCEFTGILITFLNKCSAGPQQSAALGYVPAASAGTSGGWGSHGQPPGVLSGQPLQPLEVFAYRWVLFSSCTNGMAQPPSHAA